MPIGTETRNAGQYNFQVWNDAWGDPATETLWMTFTIQDANGTRTEAQMEVIAQDIVDRLTAGGFDLVTGAKAVIAGSDVTPTT